MKNLNIHKPILKLLFLVTTTSLISREFITFGTGEVDGTYYPIGQSICKLINTKQSQIRCSVESTYGSIYNINAIKNEEFNLGISQSDTIYHAIYGETIFKSNKNKKLRSVIAVYSELLTFIVNKQSQIKDISDIKGKRISTGNKNSGSELTTLGIFKEYKIKRTDLLQMSSLKSTDTADALRDNQIDGYFFMVGHPTQNIKDAIESLDISIVPIKGKIIDQFLVKNPYFSKAFISGNLYDGINESIETIGAKSIIISSTDVSEELVYTFVKLIMENFDEFKKLHVVLENITKESLLQGLVAPQHKGAIKYFKEINLIK
ncbi:MAG: TRAP transporter TAXI family solute receptor [Arcobacteraceae bacterium]|jgi:TRAP transporter TAXI family solute receptor